MSASTFTAYAQHLLPQERPVTLYEIERNAILNALNEASGSTVHAARVLGVSQRKIQYRLKEYVQALRKA